MSLLAYLRILFLTLNASEMEAVSQTPGSLDLEHTLTMLTPPGEGRFSFLSPFYSGNQNSENSDCPRSRWLLSGSNSSH